MSSANTPHPVITTLRGAEARTRLVEAATLLFADKGFGATSTREICQAAGVNVASIHYYFGDKDGLYRAVLLRPIQDADRAFQNLDDPSISLARHLHHVIGAICCPDNQVERAAMMRLYLRELIEPTAGCADLIFQHIQPQHERLVSCLARHVGAPADAPSLHQLAFAIVALAHDQLSRRVLPCRIATQAPPPDDHSAHLERLVDWALALVDHEKHRFHSASNLSRTPT
ncbi:CerR family C-terminal domain-containing protein [Leptothrix ochracea]|uniref:CerR family C-terminal domain-containing protein n=1 Tax=Leptothrix ochracea TaxID=735331 RepID=UPI0034E23DBB